MVSLTVRELLAFEVVRAAAPVVLAGEQGLDRPVRWVHSSEIFEIAPLLSGGEFLLTTGLGLAHADAGTRRHYVRELAVCGIVGLAFETGRSFAAVPPEMIEEAARRGLPLVELREVVPFIRISEVVNTSIVDHSGLRLRLGDVVTRALNEALVDGAGISRLLDTAVVLTGCPLVLVSASGDLVAARGVADNRAAWAAVDGAEHRVPMVLHGEEWGRLFAGPGSHLAHDDLDITLTRTAWALSIAALGVDSVPEQRDRQVGQLLADLVGDSAQNPADLRMRLELAGLRPTAGSSLVGVAVDVVDSVAAKAVLDGAARLLGTRAVRARVSRLVLGLLLVRPGQTDPLGVVRRALEETLSRSGTTRVRVGVGLPVPDRAPHVRLGGTLREASAAVAVDPSLVVGRPAAAAPFGVVVDARSVLLELQLLQRPETDLHVLVDQVLGPLVEWDRTHGTALVRTVEHHLRLGVSATRTAEALRLGRQSLYQRLQRIESLLGHPVNDPVLHPALLIAACAHRLLEGRARKSSEPSASEAYRTYGTSVVGPPGTPEGLVV